MSGPGRGRAGRVRLAELAAPPGAGLVVAVALLAGPGLAPAQPAVSAQAEGAEDLRLRLDQDAYRARLTPEVLESARAERERMRREWLANRPPPFYPVTPGPPPAAGPPPALQLRFEQEWARQRALQQERAADQARARAAAGSRGPSAGQLLRQRQHEQAESASERPRNEMLRPSTSPLAPRPAAPGWLR
jgi:hypothetical protein